jgi:hypothetical protein
MSNPRPPTRKIVTDYSAEHKSHAEQLRAMADDILKHMRNSMLDPRELKTYAECFGIIRKLLDEPLTTETKEEVSNVDTSEFE